MVNFSIKERNIQISRRGILKGCTSFRYDVKFENRAKYYSSKNTGVTMGMPKELEPLSQIVNSALMEITNGQIATLPRVAITGLLDDFQYAWLKSLEIPYNFEMLDIARSLYSGQNGIIFITTNTKTIEDIRNKFSEFIMKWHKNDNRVILSLSFDGKQIDSEWIELEKYLKLKNKKIDENNANKSELDDLILTQHALFKVMNETIIPCSCGAFRKIVQRKNPDLLVTECPKCKSLDPFNIADLTVLMGGLFKLALYNETKLKTPNVTAEEVFQMIDDIQNHEGWVKEMEGQNLREQLKVLKGGLSKQEKPKV